jgi:hypothetical protein
MHPHSSVPKTTTKTNNIMPSSPSIQQGNAPPRPHAEEQTRKVGCCRWLLAELPVCGSLTAFSPVDPNGKTIDLHRSFCTGQHRPTWDILLVKFVLWGLTVSTFVYGFFVVESPSFYMAFVSYWTLLYSCVYMTQSLTLAFTSEPSRFLLRSTWVMYTNASVHGIIIVLVFWLTEYGPETEVSYFLIMSHGVSFLMTIMDGLWINRTPVRLQHYLFALVFASLYIGWTVLQALLPIDNPNKDGDDEGENLYNILDWVESPLDSAIVCIGLLFVAMPLFTLLFWGLSLCKRHYVRGDAAQENVENDGAKKDQSADTEVETPQVELMEREDC